MRYAAPDPLPFPLFSRFIIVWPDSVPVREIARLKASRSPKPRAAGLLGIGLDNQDGHTRLTRGDNFVLVGGSQETHERMQETAVRVNEHLQKKGQRLADISPRDLAQLVHDVQHD